MREPQQEWIGEACRTPVVTAFVYSGDKVALVRRSDRVRTYKGRWAGFSGYVEQLPLEQAMRELNEEAGLVPEALKLKGIGIPVSVDDMENDASWLVFPFLFELPKGPEIATDWESTELQWFSPTEISGLQTVPALDCALASVWPPFGDDIFWRELSAVATDTEQGASALARRGLEAVGGFVQANYSSLGRADLYRTIRAFAACRPVMGVFPNLAARLLLAMQSDTGLDAVDALVTELLGALQDSVELSTDAAYEAIRDKKRLFTLSYSEAVRDTIVKRAQGGEEVMIAESLPGGEGKTLADELHSKHIRVTVVSDAEVPVVVSGVDAVIVGCDGITGDDLIINKVGTRGAVEAARAAGVPAFCIAQTSKIEPTDWPLFLEERLIDPDQGIHAPIFDCTPLAAFADVITEEGPLTPGGLLDIRSELDSADLICGA
jgi:translation initiation factor 2B subunit (eIF-2B alpha/beta/delta family)/8-oxo-dGTP pyrophosphatase MutT (NUDIX family)